MKGVALTTDQQLLTALMYMSNSGSTKERNKEGEREKKIKRGREIEIKREREK
jgi:hypothetical protein